jgi:hypothetical protein
VSTVELVAFRARRAVGVKEVSIEKYFVAHSTIAARPPGDYQVL